MTLCGIDLGTSGARVAMFDTDGNELCSRNRTTPLFKSGDSRAETDATAVLAVVCEMLQELTGELNSAGRRVDALSLSVLGEATVPVDRLGWPVDRAPLSMDMRGAGPAELARNELGEARLTDITGQPVHPMFTVYKLAAEHERWRSLGAVRYQSVGEFVASHLGARPAIDYTMAARTGMYSVSDRTWSTEVASLLRVPLDGFAEPLPPGTVIGAVSAAAAQETGLHSGTPIVLGGHDQALGYLGGGGQLKMSSVLSFGSSDCLIVGSLSRPEGAARGGIASYELTEHHWLNLAGTAAGGWALNWLARLVHATSPEQFQGLFSNLRLDPSELIVLPYFAGSGTLDNDANATGAIVGLTLETTAEELAAGFVEAAGYEFAKIKEAFGGLNINLGEVVAVGSGSVNRSAMQMRASASAISMRGGPRHAAVRGAAMLAGVGIGAFASLNEIPRPQLEVDVEVQPYPQHELHYANQRLKYTELYEYLRSMRSLRTTA